MFVVGCEKVLAMSSRCIGLGVTLLAMAFPNLSAQISPHPDLAVNPPPEVKPLDPALPTIFIAGDSTAARANGDPHQGWGEPFADYFDRDKVNIANRARGGRSSRTFITEGLWASLLADVKAGDVVLLQFGHNDAGAINEEPPGSDRPLRARGTLPGLGDESQDIINAIAQVPETVHTFGWYMRRMIEDTRAKGATPILLTLTVRNVWRDDKVERGSGRYREWIAELARREEVAFVDLTRLIADHYQTQGAEAVKAYFPRDHVHTNLEGARLNAELVVAGLLGLREAPPVGPFLSERGRCVEPDRIGWLNLPEPMHPELPTLFLIGDSTVRNGRGDGGKGEWGWGEPLAELVDPAKANLVNRAVGGLSSRTFLTQGHWERVKTLLKPGDFVLMQFGHNDSGALNDDSRARGTIRGVGDETEEIDSLLTKQREVVHTYGWYLRNYVRETRAAGATPIVVSPIPRKRWTEAGRIVRPEDSYPQWAKAVAEEEDVAFVDLYDRVARRYDELGAEAVDRLFADAHTHTSRAGAELNASIVAEALRNLSALELGRFLRPE
jgi:lysophospholipase L1-like esterase